MDHATASFARDAAVAPRLRVLLLLGAGASFLRGMKHVCVSVMHERLTCNEADTLSDVQVVVGDRDRDHDVHQEHPDQRQDDDLSSQHGESPPSTLGLSPVETAPALRCGVYTRISGVNTAKYANALRIHAGRALYRALRHPFPGSLKIATSPVRTFPRNS